MLVEATEERIEKKRATKKRRKERRSAGFACDRENEGKVE